MGGFDPVAILRGLFLAGTLVLLLFVWRSPLPRHGGRAGLDRLAAFVIAAVFVAIYAYQATWQLAGFARPRFVQFMRRYNPRPVNAARAQMRGAITDCAGVPLARTRAPAMRREYPLGPAAAHLIGYADPVYGLAGIERLFDDRLLGRAIGTTGEWNQFGRNLLDHSQLAGMAVRLTLDADLQREAHRLMAGRAGAVIVMDLRRGDVLALYSAPGFDPAHLEPALFTPAAHAAPMLNRALNGLYPPGSTFKLLMAVAALEAGFDSPLECPAAGYIAESGTRPIRDHEYYEHQRAGRTWSGHGRLALPAAFSRSSNVFFAQLGVRLGSERIQRLMERCGLANRVAIRLTPALSLDSSEGQVPELDPRHPGTVAQVAIGQGPLLLTPLHVLMLTAAIGGDGRPPLPRLLQDAPVAFADTPWFDAGVAIRLRALMRDAVRTGTGRRADLPGLDVAGKTGTAQTPRGADHAWFTCLAPEFRPRIALVVLVEHGGYGASGAAPVAAELLKRAVARGYLRGTTPLEGATPP